MKSIQDILRQKSNNSLRRIGDAFGITLDDAYKKPQLTVTLAEALSKRETFDLFYSILTDDEIDAIKKCIRNEAFAIRQLLIFDTAGYVHICNNGRVFVSETILNLISTPPVHIDAQARLLYNYFKAFSNLYGFLHLDYAIDLINEYEGQQYTKEDLMKYLQLLDLCHPDFFIADFMFIINTDAMFLGNQYIMELIDAQDGKEYAHLSKEDVLRYLDFEYAEQTPQYKQLESFCLSQPHMQKERTLDLLENIIGMCKADWHIDDVIEKLKDFDVYLYREADCKLFRSLYQDVKEHLRTWENRGNTPTEVRIQAESEG